MKFSNPQERITKRRPPNGWEPEPTGELEVTLGKAKIEHGKRYLLTANPDGSPNVREIPWNAAIASQERYLEMMMEPNGCYVSTEVLQAFIDAATARLGERMKVKAIAGGAK